MAVRSSMATLIGRLRTLIADPSGVSQTFSDQELQNFLDARQRIVRYDVLRPEPTVVAPGNTVSYLDMYAADGDWESDWKLYDPSWAQLTPTASDEIVGHWTFTTNQLWPVRIVGKNYDLYGSAADALEAWAAKVALDFDFSTDGQRFSRSQKRTALMELAEQYRRRQQPQAAQSKRSDTYGDTVGIYPYTGIWFDW